MISSKPLVISISIVIISILVLHVVSPKTQSNPIVFINKKIYVGYIPSILGGISCEINFTTNRASTLTAGYGITEEIPLNGGLVTNPTFSCDFKEIVKDNSRLLNFEKRNEDFNITFVKANLDAVSSVFSPYRIHDIAHIYGIFVEKRDIPSTVAHTSSNNSIYVGYIGISEENQKNLFFIDIDYQNQNVYTITNQTIPIPVKGIYTGDLNSNFKVQFPNSFLGIDQNLEFKRIDFNTYNVTLLNSRISFPMEVLSIVDISKLYSLLVFEGAIGLQFKKMLNRGRIGNNMMGRKMRYGFPKTNRAMESHKFMEIYKSTKMVQLDFQNTIKSLQHNKKILAASLNKNK